MTEQEVIALALKNSLELFTRYFFKIHEGKKFQVSDHHKRIFSALEKVASGEIKRLIISMPPRYGKTEIAVKGFIAWCIANNPQAKFIHLSYSDDLALDNSTKIRDIVKLKEFQDLFHAPIRKDSDSKKKWYTEAGGGLYATSAGGAVTGFGAGSASEREHTGTGSAADGFGGAIIIDDALKPDDAIGVERTKVNNRFNNTIASRVNDPRTTPIIVIMQRLHEDDLTGFLLKGGSGDEWEHLCLPALNEYDEALWPEKHSVEMLKKMEQANPYVFASQYMQRPSPLGGGIIKGEWFNRYSLLPAIEHASIYADTAQKTAERNDYSVLELWGKGKDGNIYLIDLIRGKWEAWDLEQRAFDFWQKWRNASNIGTLRNMKIEDKASGTGLIQNLRRKGIFVEPIPRSRDKLTRAMDGVPAIKSGFVYLPENAPFVSDFIYECEAFTADDTHANDDQIDPMLDAIQDMTGKIDLLSWF